MKQIDFSKEGGFPLTQDTLSYLQSAYTDVLRGLAASRGTGPYIISGCVITSTGTNATMSNGYIYYNGEIYRVQGSTIGAFFVLPAQPGLILAINNTSLIYNNGVANTTAQQEQYFYYSGISNGSLTSSQIPFTSLQPFIKDATAGSVVVGGAGAPTGNIGYRKNWLNNTLQIAGVITLSNAQIVAATSAGTGPQYYRICTLPVAPASTIPFTLYYRYITPPMLDDTGTDYITTLNGEITTDGFVNVGWRKPAAGVTSYTVSFNTIIPLD